MLPTMTIALATSCQTCGIELAVLVGFLAFLLFVLRFLVVLANGPRRDPLRDDDPLPGRLRRLEEAVQPRLEAETVLEDDVRIFQHDEVGRRRVVGVGIDAGPDQRCHLHGVAADVLHQIAQHAETGDDLQRLARRRRLRGCRDGQQKDERQARQDASSSVFHEGSSLRGLLMP